MSKVEYINNVRDIGNNWQNDPVSFWVDMRLDTLFNTYKHEYDIPTHHMSNLVHTFGADVVAAARQRRSTQIKQSRKRVGK
jgi:hypothetical protein